MASDDAAPPKKVVEKFACEVCGVSSHKTATYRVNPKGEPGIFRCEACLETPPDRDAKELVDIIAAGSPPSDAAPVAVDCENCKTLERWVHDLQSGMFINCVYCGHRYGPDDKVAPTMQQALYDHIAECPKHPLSAMKRRAERAEARLAHPEDAPEPTYVRRENIKREVLRYIRNEVDIDALQLKALADVIDGASINPEDAPRPDKASQGSTVSGGVRPEQVGDAPEGPWEIKSTGDQDEFLVVSKSGFIGPFSQRQAVAHRDALNRLKGVET